MYARIAYAWPAAAPHSKLKDEIGAIDANLKDALQRLDRLASFDEETGDLIRKPIKLSPKARDGFEGFRGFVHQQRQILEGREREWMAKAPTHVLRLAGTLCLLDWAWDKESSTEPIEIEALYITRSIKLVKEYFWPHARAALRLAGRPTAAWPRSWPWKGDRRSLCQCGWLR
jgi:hypothetical protein